jgi:hypothetical protein
MTDDTKIAEIAQILREWRPGLDGSTHGLKAVMRRFPDATPDQIQQAIRSETRLMPFADRKREFAMVLVCLIEERSGGDPEATLGEMITAEEFAMLATNFHLVGTRDGEWRDALS